MESHQSATTTVDPAPPFPALSPPCSGSQPEGAWEVFREDQSARIARANASLQAMTHVLPKMLAVTILLVTVTLLPAQPVTGDFTRALELLRRDRPADAERLLKDLDRRNPGYPEVLNNLAVAQARAGDLDAARLTLERAIRTQPNLSVMVGNLGEIYSWMASQAYSEALGEAYPRSARRPPPLATVEKIHPSPEDLHREKLDLRQQIARLRDSVSFITTAVASAASDPPPSPPKRPIQPPAVPPKHLATVPPPPASEPPAPSAVTATRPSPPKEPSGLTPEDAVRAWAHSWSARDVAAYLSAYSSSFRPRSGLSRPAWEAQRRERLQAPQKIEVELDNLRVTSRSGSKVTVTFLQRYTTETIRLRTPKILQLQLEDGHWRIVSEETGR